MKRIVVADEHFSPQHIKVLMNLVRALKDKGYEPTILYEKHPTWADYELEFVKEVFNIEQPKSVDLEHVSALQKLYKDDENFREDLKSLCSAIRANRNLSSLIYSSKVNKTELLDGLRTVRDKEIAKKLFDALYSKIGCEASDVNEELMLHKILMLERRELEGTFFKTTPTIPIDQKRSMAFHLADAFIEDAFLPYGKQSLNWWEYKIPLAYYDGDHELLEKYNLVNLKNEIIFCNGNLIKSDDKDKKKLVNDLKWATSRLLRDAFMLEEIAALLSATHLPIPFLGASHVKMMAHYANIFSLEIYPGFHSPLYNKLGNRDIIPLLPDHVESFCQDYQEKLDKLINEPESFTVTSENPLLTTLSKAEVAYGNMQKRSNHSE
ncbi:MAG: hypothetical protein AAF621_01410 [Pseudomonadota bacterium]